MNTTAKCTPVMIALWWIAFSSTGTANLSLVDTYKSPPETTAHILAVARARLGEPDLTNLLRLDNLDQPPSGSPFTIVYPASNTADISWDLSGSGFDLLAVYIYGGSNGANLYKITDTAQMISGSATIHPPVTGNSRQFAVISHTLFLGVAVPEPTSAILFIIGSGGLILWRLRRR